MAEDKVPQNRVLVVDDNEDVLEATAMLLRRSGYVVETASSAFEALERFTGTDGDEICVLISDISMPGMNGYELARQLRQLPQCKTVVMIALTGLSIYGDRARALAAGFDDLIVKPIGPRSLIATIERLRKSRR